MYATNEQCLVLDQAYQPVEIVHWSRAVALWFQDKAEIISEYDGFVRSTSVVIKIPAVVRLLRAIRRSKKPVKFSRINVYGRDGYKCQYCSKKHSVRDLTYDHVVPRAQGGKTTWTNIVTACSECNGKKAGRTPEQAGMKLARSPKQPTALPSLHASGAFCFEICTTTAYLYWTGEPDSD